MLKCKHFNGESQPPDSSKWENVGLMASQGSTSYIDICLKTVYHKLHYGMLFLMNHFW